MRSGVQSSPVAPVFYVGLLMNLPILYSFRRCPYAIRARLAILVSGMTCELREVSLANKPEAMLLASPKATIPVMVLPDRTVLEESLDIMKYALGSNDPEGWLLGVDETTMELVRINDAVFKDHLDRYKYPDRYEGDRLQHRAAGLAILQMLEGHLEKTGKLIGLHDSLIDFAILPFVRQFAAVDEVWFASQSIPHVQSWLAQFLASPRFAQAMISLSVWKSGDGPTFFPSQSL
jgi:glutathione S-transferase